MAAHEPALSCAVVLSGGGVPPSASAVTAAGPAASAARLSKVFLLYSYAANQTPCGTTSRSSVACSPLLSSGGTAGTAAAAEEGRRSWSVSALVLGS